MVKFEEFLRYLHFVVASAHVIKNVTQGGNVFVGAVFCGKIRAFALVDAPELHNGIDGFFVKTTAVEVDDRDERIEFSVPCIVGNKRAFAWHDFDKALVSQFRQAEIDDGAAYLHFACKFALGGQFFSHFELSGQDERFDLLDEQFLHGRRDDLIEFHFSLRCEDWFGVVAKFWFDQIPRTNYMTKPDKNATNFSEICDFLAVNRYFFTFILTLSAFSL